MRERSYKFDPLEHRQSLLPILREVVLLLEQAPPGPLPQSQLHGALRRYPRAGKGFFSRSELIAGYAALAGDAGLSLPLDAFAARLRMRPVRTHSGVTPITVLSKPYPCPGRCVFCPNDVRMPKSYLSDEPGCQRAEQNGFDPYLQTYNRMLALASIGHSVDKVELIVLGGTWSFYPETYQRWFIKRCFDAINDFGRGVDGRVEGEAQRFQLVPLGATAEGRGAASYNRYVERHLRLLSGEGLLRNFEDASWEQLGFAQRDNELAPSRCVGLVLETRPDYVNLAELTRLRRLGCTKVQLGIQSLSDDVLRQNKRGHDLATTRSAMALLRGMGFKVLAHFMPNLLGASPAADIAGIERMFEDEDFRPDELKVYPCSLIATAELMNFYEVGQWRPYTEQELLDVLCEVISKTPKYCRLSRVIRDISSGDIVVGNRKSNFREDAERALDARGIQRRDIRSREVAGMAVDPTTLGLSVTRYKAGHGTECFIELVTPADRIAGFCRLRLSQSSALVELQGSGIIRELHVYGPAQGLGQRKGEGAQHRGIGERLMAEAGRLTREAGFSRLAVISAVGTRAYYRRHGFEDGELYQHLRLTKPAT